MDFRVPVCTYKISMPQEAELLVNDFSFSTKFSSLQSEMLKLSRGRYITILKNFDLDNIPKTIQKILQVCSHPMAGNIFNHQGQIRLIFPPAICFPRGRSFVVVLDIVPATHLIVDLEIHFGESDAHHLEKESAWQGEYDPAGASRAGI